MDFDWTDRETWRFVNSFAAWLSALGTLAAVIVALYIANMQNRVRLRVSATKQRLVASGQRIKDGEPVVIVSVTNLSHRAVKVSGVYWQARWRKSQSLQLPSDHPLSAQLPRELPADVGTASFIFPEGVYSDPRGNLELTRKLFGGRLARLKSRFVRVGVTTTIGKRFESNPDPFLRDWFVALAKGIDEGPGSQDVEEPAK